jgi:hypothetical protein
MPNRRQNQEEIREHLAQQLDWQYAERNDQAVAQALYAGQEVDAIHTLDEAGLLDGFFAFLSESEVMSVWKRFKIEAIQRIFIPTIYFVLLYGTRLLFGIESSNALPGLLFSNVAVMTLLGFNAAMVANGMTQRGQSQRTGERSYVLMDPQTLAESICKSSATELERLFNGTIACLAAFGICMAEVMVAVDGTQIVTSAQFEGCGCLRTTQKRRNEQGIEVKVVELVYGWRLIALVDLVTLIPLAIRIVQIQANEAPYLLGLVRQAQANLAPHSKIVRLVIDRAYVDGATLYQLDQMGIQFVLIAKRNLVAYGTALAASVESPLTYERIETVTHGHGRNQGTETLLTQVEIASGIRTWESYRPPPQAGTHLRHRDRPALNAVIVRMWRNHEPKQGPRIYLTNGSVDDPWSILDIYDDRSWIENGLFRNSKQFWHLTRWFPKRTEAGVRSHLTFVMLMVATATAYRLWSKIQSHPADAPIALQPIISHRIINRHTGEIVSDSRSLSRLAAHLASPPLLTPKAQHDSDGPEPGFSHHLLQGQGIERWRRQLQQENRDKLIVFIGEQYGIFDTHEFLVLTGVPLRSIPSILGTREDILHRYHCLGQPP